jgi:phosphotransferase system  glucose/maltose/N-acetylglucosamine-specific IIC component
MNRLRLLGFVILAIGIGINLVSENDGTGFISGFLLGSGAILLITGRIGKIKSNQIASDS